MTAVSPERATSAAREQTLVGGADNVATIGPSEISWGNVEFGQDARKRSPQGHHVVGLAGRPNRPRDEGIDRVR